MKYQFFRGHNTVIEYCNAANSSSPALIFDKNEFAALEDCLRKENIEGAVQIVEDITEDLAENSNVVIDQARKSLFNIYLLISSIYMDNMLEIENDNDILWAKVFMTGELSTIRRFILNKLLGIGDRIKLVKSNREKSVIKEIEDYIIKNYDKDISINSISNEVYLAPTYLCLLFKREKGETINEYITRLRIEKAKELLKDRRVKLYEVARRVGYNDSNYFAKVFKKITGYNPSEYRDSL